MEKIKKEIISYIVYYFVIFFVAPFIALGSGWIVKDFGWFLIYSLFIFPTTFLFCLWLYRKNFKNKTVAYKKFLFVIWGVFLLTYIISASYIY